MIARTPRRSAGTAPFVASILGSPQKDGVAPDRALQVLLDCGEEGAQIGSWDWRLDTDRLLWSDNLYRIFGLEPGAVTPSPSYVVAQSHPR